MSSYCSAWIPQQILKSNYNPFPNPPSQFYNTVAFVWRAFHCRRRRQQNTVLCKRDNHVHKFRSVSRSRRRWWRSQSSLAAAAKCVALACPSLLHTAVLCCYMKGFGEVYLCMHKYRLFRSFCAGKSPCRRPFWFRFGHRRRILLRLAERFKVGILDEYETRGWEDMPSSIRVR